MLIDWDYLHQISGGSEAFELELIQALLTSLPEHLNVLREALLRNDYQTVRLEAHYIKGSSASIGVNLMRDCAEQLEQNAQQENLKDAASLLTKIEESFDQIQALVDMN